VPGPPPPCPDGWAVAPPDFVGVGAQRSGTTRWYDLICAHPRVSPPPAIRKELHFFDRFHAGGWSEASAAEYAAHFPRPPGSLSGEWTPTYLQDFWTAPLLAAAAPDARLIVSLRDPVTRYLSGLQRHHRAARHAGEALDHAAAPEEFVRGLYADALERLLATAGRERVLVLQYERCVADPAGELARTLAFLGLEPFDAGDLLHTHHPNRQREPAPIDALARRALVDAYRPDVARLSAIWPELDIELWPGFATA
jgi:hypothetical protein